MEKISLSKKNYENLESLDLPNQITPTEGKIYQYNYKNQKRVFKELYYLNDQIIANKLYTLEMLDNYREFFPASFYIPDYLVTYKNEMIGFSLLHCPGVNFENFLNNKKINLNDKLDYLKKIGDLLEEIAYMREFTPVNDFYLNDIHAANFMVNPSTKELGVVDLDSCKIGENEAFAAQFLTPLSLAHLVPYKYHVSTNSAASGYIKANLNSDLYCYMIMVLNFLYGGAVHRLTLVEYYEYLNYLEDLGFHKSFIEAAHKLVTPSENVNFKEFILSFTEEQVGRARRNVYQRVQKK